MKRLIAAIIDGFIANVFFTVPAVIQRGFFDASPLPIIRLIVFFIIHYLYSFIFDYFYEGYTFGKRLLKVKIIFEEKQSIILLKYSFLHSFFRVFSFSIFPVSFLIYLIYKCKMPYDKILRVKIE